MKEIRFKSCKIELPTESGLYLCFKCGFREPSMVFFNILAKSPWETPYVVYEWLDVKDIPGADIPSGLMNS